MTLYSLIIIIIILLIFKKKNKINILFIYLFISSYISFYNYHNRCE